MNSDIDEIEAILKPTTNKRRIILIVMTIALALLIGLGLASYSQVDYMQVCQLKFHSLFFRVWV